MAIRGLTGTPKRHIVNSDRPQVKGPKARHLTKMGLCQAILVYSMLFRCYFAALWGLKRFVGDHRAAKAHASSLSEQPIILDHAPMPKGSKILFSRSRPPSRPHSLSTQLM